MYVCLYTYKYTSLLGPKTWPSDHNDIAALRPGQAVDVYELIDRYTQKIGEYIGEVS